MTDQDVMKWGKYKGKKLAKVPGTYLLWIADQPWMEKWPELAAYIDENRATLEAEAEGK